MKFGMVFGKAVKEQGSQVYLKLDNGETVKFHQEQVQEATAFEYFMYLLDNTAAEDISGNSEETTVVLRGYNYDVMATTVTINYARSIMLESHSQTNAPTGL